LDSKIPRTCCAGWRRARTSPDPPPPQRV